MSNSRAKGLMCIRFRQLALTPSSGEWSPIFLQKSTLQQQYISNVYSWESYRFLWASRVVALPRTVSPFPTIPHGVLQKQPWMHNRCRLVVTATERFFFYLNHNEIDIGYPHNVFPAFTSRRMPECDFKLLSQPFRLLGI